MQLEENSINEKRQQLIAFGALERVIVTSVAPEPKELQCIERPDYIDC